MKKIKLFLLLLPFLFINAVNAQTKYDSKTLQLNEKNTQVTSKIMTIMESESYPLYYGGTYISDDSSSVILQIVKENIPESTDSRALTTYNKIVNMDQNIKIEYVKNSYSKLNEINNKLVKHYSSKSTDISNLSSHYVDIFSNKVIVELLDNSSEKTLELKQNVLKETKDLTSEVIEFKIGRKQQNHATSLNAGQSIATNGIPNNCSMGYRVKINGVSGYITAGHCFNGTGESATGGTATRYKESGTVDAAFVQTTSSYTPTNTLAYKPFGIADLNATMSPVLSVNTVVAKSGYKTGYTTGQIKSLNYSGTYDGIYFTNLIAANYSTAGGDSGGPVFTPGSSNSLVAGINKGTSSYGSAFVNADQIYSAFGYIRY